MYLHQQISQLFAEDSKRSFNDVAIKVFRHQAQLNKVYKEYLHLLKIKPQQIVDYQDIPLLPIEFFKNYPIKSGKWKAEKVFLSSGTSGMARSRHQLKDKAWYNQNAINIAQASGLDLANTQVLALLPSYIENGDSSLVHMVEHFVQVSQTPSPQFFLYEHEALKDRILSLLSRTNKDILLIGVTFALLDFAKVYPIANDRLKILFTGGMKNRGAEMMVTDIRQELQSAFTKSTISSEYGMTELLSQCYAVDSERYTMPASLRVVPKDLNDPLSNYKYGKSALLGIIDLANVDTLSFILTQDIGVVHSDKSFEILGRASDSDLRGCNLLYNPHQF